MEWDEPRLAEFRPADGQQRLGALDVRIVKRQGFRDPQPRHHEQTKQRGIRHPAESRWRGELPRGLEEPRNVLVPIERRGLAVIPGGQQIDRRDFGERVGHVAPLGKPSHDLEPRVHADRTEIRDVRRPAPREIGRHAWGAFPFGKAGEEVKDARRFVQRAPEPSSERQVVFDCQTQGGHRAPPGIGQGWASVRRRSTSTFA